MPKKKDESVDPQTEESVITPEPVKSIKVRATQPGYFGDIYRSVDDVFWIHPRVIPIVDENKIDAEPKTKTISAEQQFSKRWMEVVPDSEPERITTAQTAINRESGKPLVSAR